MKIVASSIDVRRQADFLRGNKANSALQRTFICYTSLWERKLKEGVSLAWRVGSESVFRK